MPPENRSLTRASRPNATKVMVVYSKNTGVRRRVIDADDDSEYQAHIDTMHAGEGYFFLATADYDAHDNPHTLNHTTATQAGFKADLVYHAGTNVVHDVVVHYKKNARPPAPSNDHSMRLVDRHDILDPAGNVVGACHADPTCGDSGEHFAPGHTLVPNEGTGPGWK